MNVPSRTESVSQGALPGHNEDHVLTVERPGIIDLVVLDGATSVADGNHIDAAGDVAWFVRRFAAALEDAIHAGLDQEPAVQGALAAVRADFLACPGSAGMPFTPGRSRR